MEFVKQLLAAIGGALGIVLIIMRLGKSIIQKWVETNIESSAEKSLNKYTNLLERKTRAYEMILEKEFEFYQCATDYMSRLVFDIQAFPDYFSRCNGGYDDARYQYTKEVSSRIDNDAQFFRRSIILLQPFIPNDLYCESIELIQNLKYSMYKLNDALEMSVTDILPENIIEPAKSLEEEIISNCSTLAASIKRRLEELSKE